MTRRLVAEAVGTFVLVFFARASPPAPRIHRPDLGQARQPAVALGMLLRRGLVAREAGAYVGASRVESRGRPLTLRQSIFDRARGDYLTEIVGPAPQPWAVDSRQATIGAPEAQRGAPEAGVTPRSVAATSGLAAGSARSRSGGRTRGLPTMSGGGGWQLSYPPC